MFIVLFLIIGFFALLFEQFISIFFDEWQQRIHTRWLEHRANKQHRKESKQAYKNCRVTLKNKFLNALTRIKIILFSGVAGSGKTLAMNLLSKWLHDKRSEFDYKNRRMQKYLFPEYLKEKQRLFDKDLLDIYSNIDMQLNNLKTQDSLAVIEQLQKAVQHAVILLDEIGSTLPKAKYFELLQKSNIDEADRMKRIADFARYIRHYIDGWILATEQDGSNILIDIRRFGYAQVNALGTWTHITLWGKIKKFFMLLFNFILPAGIVGHPIRTINEQLFLKDKIICFFKLFLINYFNGYYYYSKKLEIINSINKKYTIFKLLLEYNGQRQFLIFGNDDILEYDTRCHASEYQSKFNEEGNAKGVNYESNNIAA